MKYKGTNLIALWNY